MSEEKKEEGKEAISRRKYLGAVGGLAAAAVIGWGVAGYLASKPPAAVKTVTKTETITVTGTPAVTTPGKLTKLKMGVQGPMTGPAAYAGKDFMNAYKLALEERGNKIAGIPVELVPIDCESDPEKAVRAYERAIMVEGIHVGACGWHSSVHLALMDVWAAHKFPHIAHFGAAKTILEKFRSNPEYYKWTMAKWWPIPEKLVIGYIETIFKAIEEGIITPKTKKVSIYVEDTDWGRSAGGAFAEGFRKKGWEVASFDVAPLDETEHVPMLTKIKGLDPDVLAVTWTGAAPVTSLIKQIREVGLRAIIIADGLGWITGWYEMAGKASDYVLDMIPQWATPKAKEFVEKFKKKYGYEPSPSTAGLAYDNALFAFSVVEEVLKRTGGVWDEHARELVVDIVRKEHFAFKEGILMECYTEDPNDPPDLVVGEHYYIFPVIQYFDGKGRIVWPPAWAEAKFTLPPWFK